MPPRRLAYAVFAVFLVASWGAMADIIARSLRGWRDFTEEGWSAGTLVLSHYVVDMQKGWGKELEHSPAAITASGLLLMPTTPAGDTVMPHGPLRRVALDELR